MSQPVPVHAAHNEGSASQEKAIEYQYRHLVIVHGIGDQLRNETSISFMNEFIRSLPSEVRDTVDVHNLVERIDLGATAAARPAYMTCTILKKQYVIAFSEVYWQPVPNQYLKDNEQNPPVPVFVWAHSINTRLLQGGPKFQRARDAIANLEALLHDLRSLASIYKKAGILTDVLVKFLCDVQMYVESETLRDNINKHFLEVLQNVGVMRKEISSEIRQRSGDEVLGQDICIVAHSEGTVVTYNSLVLAAAERESKPDAHSWLPNVRTLVTLGSPLDKHYTIWRNRFRTDVLKVTDLESKISWRNYWDRSDPVGYGLHKLFDGAKTDGAKTDGAKTDGVKTDGVKTDAARMFTVTHDNAFTRYLIPGKAHVDYWTDEEIHVDILQEIIGNNVHISKVADRWWWFLHVPGDYIGYLMGRVAVMLAFVFFFSRLLGPLEKLVKTEWLEAVCRVPALECTALTTWHVAFWALTLPIAINGLFEMDRDWKVGWLRAIHEAMWKARGAVPWALNLLRGAAVAAWLGVGLIVSVAWAAHDPADVAIKDWIGYATGLVVTILAWRLQTRVHTGLLQLWRYTGGHHTSYTTSGSP